MFFGPQKLMIDYSRKKVIPLCTVVTAGAEAAVLKSCSPEPLRHTEAFAPCCFGSLDLNEREEYGRWNCTRCARDYSQHRRSARIGVESASYTVVCHTRTQSNLRPLRKPTDKKRTGNLRALPLSYSRHMDPEAGLEPATTSL